MHACYAVHTGWDGSSHSSSFSHGTSVPSVNPYAAAPTSDVLPTAPPVSASQLHPLPFAGLFQTPSSPPLLQQQSPPVDAFSNAAVYDKHFDKL